MSINSIGRRGLDHAETPPPPPAAAPYQQQQQQRNAAFNMLDSRTWIMPYSQLCERLETVGGLIGVQESPHGGAVIYISHEDLAPATEEHPDSMQTIVNSLYQTGRYFSVHLNQDGQFRCERADPPVLLTWSLPAWWNTVSTSHVASTLLTGDAAIASSSILHRYDASGASEDLAASWMAALVPGILEYCPSLRLIQTKEHHARPGHPWNNLLFCLASLRSHETNMGSKLTYMVAKFLRKCIIESGALDASLVIEALFVCCRLDQEALLPGDYASHVNYVDVLHMVITHLTQQIHYNAAEKEQINPSRRASAALRCSSYALADVILGVLHKNSTGTSVRPICSRDPLERRGLPHM